MTPPITPADLRALAAAPPDPALAALWWAAQSDWTRAHEAAQSDDGAAANWVHAYLHRVEGDAENATYWYSLAQRPVSTAPLDQEWAEIAAALLANDPNLALGPRPVR